MITAYARFRRCGRWGGPLVVGCGDTDVAAPPRRDGGRLTPRRTSAAGQAWLETVARVCLALLSGGRRHKKEHHNAVL